MLDELLVRHERRNGKKEIKSMFGFITNLNQIS